MICKWMALIVSHEEYSLFISNKHSDGNLFFRIKATCEIFCFKIGIWSLQLRFSRIIWNWQYLHRDFLNVLTKNSGKKFPPARLDLGTFGVWSWCFPYWANVVLLVKLRLLRYLFGHVLLILADDKSPRSQMMQAVVYLERIRFLL